MSPKPPKMSIKICGGKKYASMKCGGQRSDILFIYIYDNKSIFENVLR